MDKPHKEVSYLKHASAIVPEVIDFLVLFGKLPVYLSFDLAELKVDT